MNENTVGALINLLKQFNPDANIVIAVRAEDDYQPIVDAQYNENGDVELILE
ncbi:hypothetical protein [Paenibacillus naphthalenovorans]|uniref:Uncharacterized protein n=1 Tax=Paenibacillus naphthalenovorans TaxID=162209 RepID=A0A0U2WA47_9BACL|nr:hypothetical protein [Paenibacillus naphthalenovorans]ALS22234.1 hypothetical protein IJ22_18600 [Paenibacillus naphthalenovorans]